MSDYLRICDPDSNGVMYLLRSRVISVGGGASHSVVVFIESDGSASRIKAAGSPDEVMCEISKRKSLSFDLDDKQEFEHFMDRLYARTRNSIYGAIDSAGGDFTFAWFLEHFTERKLMNMRGFGVSSLENLRVHLSRYDLRLKDSPANYPTQSCPT